VTLLAFVRHGEPTSYRDGGLTPAGRREAQQAAERLAPGLRGLGPVTVWTSPSRRCRESARLLAHRLRERGVPVEGPSDAPDLVMVRARVGDRLVDIGLARDRAASSDLDEFWADHRAGRNPFDRWEAEAYESFESPGAVARRLQGFVHDVDGRPAPAVAVTHSELIRIAARDLGLAGEDLRFGDVLFVGTMLRPAGADGVPGGPAGGSA
jgi:broad specificity phosphatase PhoE